MSKMANRRRKRRKMRVYVKKTERSNFLGEVVRRNYVVRAMRMRSGGGFHSHKGYVRHPKHKSNHSND